MWAGAAVGQELLLDATSVAEQAYAVAGVDGQLGEGYGGGAGEVELGVAVLAVVGDDGAHEAAGVEDDPDGLAALCLKLAGDEVAAAGGGGPADVAEVVAGAVFAEGFELTAETAVAHLAELKVDLAAACEIDLLVFGGVEFRVDADGLGEWGFGPAAQEAEGGLVAEEEVAGRGVSAMTGAEGIAEAGVDVWVGAEVVARGDFCELGREVVDEVAEEEDRTFLLDCEFYLYGRAEGWGGEPAAGGCDLLRAWKA